MSQKKLFDDDVHVREHYRRHPGHLKKQEANQGVDVGGVFLTIVAILILSAVLYPFIGDKDEQNGSDAHIINTIEQAAEQDDSLPSSDSIDEQSTVITTESVDKKIQLNVTYKMCSCGNQVEETATYCPKCLRVFSVEFTDTTEYQDCQCGEHIDARLLVCPKCSTMQKRGYCLSCGWEVSYVLDNC